jgi:steroid 5-alpha reductase family enzyme
MALLYTISAAWALRLSYHIGSRHKGEDWRYQYILKPKWQEKPYLEQILTSYAWVFGLQGLCCMINNASIMYVLRYSPIGAKLGKFEAIGLMIWLLGQSIEIIGDKQLQAHRDDPATSGTLMKSGLWRYTRHPNYFGEILGWWGIFAFACSIKAGAKTIYSALFITYLLRYISGVDMLEQKQRLKPEFRIYMEETSALLPMPYKAVDAKDKESLMKRFEKEIEEEYKLGVNPATKIIR